METKKTIHTGQILVLNTIDENNVKYSFTARIDKIHNNMINLSTYENDLEHKNNPFTQAVTDNQDEAISFFMERFLVYRNEIMTVEEANNLAKEDLDNWLNILNNGVL